jgi:hypothetical protein
LLPLRPKSDLGLNMRYVGMFLKFPTVIHAP